MRWNGVPMTVRGSLAGGLMLVGSPLPPPPQANESNGEYFV